jgi:hypothetical protein
MKKQFFFLTLLMALTISNSYAKLSSYFEIDEYAIESEFKELNDLDKSLSNELKGMSYSDLVEKKVSNAVIGLSSHPMSPNFSINEMDWGAFAWGFCCWPIGFFVVVTNKNKEPNSKLSYWIGLGTSLVFSGVSAVIRLTTAAASVR